MRCAEAWGGRGKAVGKGCCSLYVTQADVVNVELRRCSV